MLPERFAWHCVARGGKCHCRECDYRRFRRRCGLLGSVLIIAALLLWSVLVVYTFVT